MAPAAVDRWLRCSDGVALVSRVWQPEGRGPWPVLLMRQPYGRAIASTVTYAHPRWYATHGFLVVVQDVRGCGDSEGSFGGFAQEARDGAETVRWARSLPGSNGRLGTYGFSYQGLSQLLNDDPEALPDCLAPAMAGLDERLHWASEGGAHWWALGLAWALQLAALRRRRAKDAEGWQRLRASLESGRFLHEGLELLERFDPQGMGLAWLRADPATARGWRRHRLQPELLRRPLLLIGGWHDPHLGGVLDLWRRSRAAGGNPLLRIGAFSHLHWRGGLDALQLAFFRHHLQGEGERPAPAMGWQCPLGGGWHTAEAAAPEVGNRGSGGWSLASDGLAAVRSDEGRLLAAEQGHGEVVIVHDPWRPAPGRGGHLGLDAGVVERADLDQRTDVACFTSAPLAAPLTLFGQPTLELEVEADQPGFDLCAALSQLPADGGAVRQLCTGVARWRGERALGSRRRRLVLQPLGVQLAAGDRLRLSLAAAAWPQIAVNPGDGNLPLSPAGSGHRVITLTLRLAASRLWLPPLCGGRLGRSTVRV